MSNKNSDDASMTTTAELDLDEAVSRILKSDDGHRILKDALFADHKMVETLISSYLQSKDGSKFMNEQIKQFLSSEGKATFDCEIGRVFKAFFASDEGAKLVAACVNGPPDGDDDEVQMILGPNFDSEDDGDDDSEAPEPPHKRSFRLNYTTSTPEGVRVSSPDRPNTRSNAKVKQEPGSDSKSKADDKTKICDKMKSLVDPYRKFNDIAVQHDKMPPTNFKTVRSKTHAKRFAETMDQLRDITATRRKVAFQLLNVNPGNQTNEEKVYLHALLVTQLVSYNRFGLRKDVGLASIDAKIERYKIDLKKDNVLADEIDRLKDIINRLT